MNISLKHRVAVRQWDEAEALSESKSEIKPLVMQEHKQSNTAAGYAQKAANLNHSGSSSRGFFEKRNEHRSHGGMIKDQGKLA
nr:hypothetical protein Iba_chr07fCG8080 [Ipomoea batatas]